MEDMREKEPIELKALTVQEQIEDKILGEILSEDNRKERYQLIQQLELLSRALITIEDRKDK